MLLYLLGVVSGVVISAVPLIIIAQKSELPKTLVIKKETGKGEK